MRMYWGLVDEGAVSWIVSRVAFKVEPGVGVRLGRGEIGAAEFVATAILLSLQRVEGPTLPDAGTAARDALVEFCCFESEICGGRCDGNRD